MPDQTVAELRVEAWGVLLERFGESYELDSGTAVQGVPSEHVNQRAESGARLPRADVKFLLADIPLVKAGDHLVRLRDHRMLAVADREPDGLGFVWLTLASRGE